MAETSSSLCSSERVDQNPRPFLIPTWPRPWQMNFVLLLGLLAIYVDIYRKTGSEFTLGLIIFCVAFLLYAVTSNPWVHQLLGYRGSGLGPFAMLPDTFTLVASVVLLYLSQK